MAQIHHQPHNAGTTEDGRPLEGYHLPDKHVVYVGRDINQAVELPNGEVLNLGYDCLVFDTKAEAQKAAHHISKHLATNGHPKDPGFTYDESKGTK